jgi:hypothetical protein
MAILRSTSPNQLGKYVLPLIEILNESMTRNTPIKVGTKSVILKNNDFNKKAIKEWQKLGMGGAKTQSQALNISLQTNDSKNPVIAIGSLEKPKVNVNKGDASEGIIAAAIAARFLHKDKPIKTADVFALIRKLAKTKIKNYTGKAGKYIEVEYDSPNKNPKISDVVRTYISLAEVNMTALLDPKNEDILEEYADSAVKYVNSDHVSEWAITLYENNRFDRIEVVSDGLGGQKTTKVDVRVKVTDDKGKLVPVNINLSLKAGDVKQFGQVGGSEFEKQKELWEKFFGYGGKIASLESKYDNTMFKKKKGGEAIGMVFEKISDLLNNDFKGKNATKLIKKMADAVKYFATLNEDNVTLLQLGGGKAAVYEFEKVYEKIKARKFESRVTYGGSELPTLFISSGGKDFLKVRVKQEFKPDGKPYIRNYIEKESLFTDILATVL